MADYDLSAQTLRIQFSYDSETGQFTRRGESKPSGRIATKGYRQIAIIRKRFMAHRLAWLYVHGEWPSGQIDHINQNKDDNRIENLRIVDNKQNQENVTAWGHNKTGRRGVCFIQSTGQWQADIKHNGKPLYLGRFDTVVDAVAARIRAEQTLFTHTPYYAKITHKSVFPLSSTVAPGTRNEN